MRSSLIDSEARMSVQTDENGRVIDIDDLALQGLAQDEASYKHDVALQLLEECALDPFRQRVML